MRHGDDLEDSKPMNPPWPTHAGHKLSLPVIQREVTTEISALNWTNLQKLIIFFKCEKVATVTFNKKHKSYLFP